jgi:hypothetical protein
MDKKELIRVKALAPVKITTPICGWDESDITDGQVTYLTEENNEDYLQRLSEAMAKEVMGHPGIKGERTEQEILKIKNKLIEEIRSEVLEDQDIFEMAFNDLNEELTQALRALTKTQNGETMYFRVNVNDFGWRKQTGYKYMKVQDGKELLRETLPDTQCIYRFFKVRHGKKLAMQNFHHDSPMGEWYVITPIAYSTYMKMHG